MQFCHFPFQIQSGVKMMSDASEMLAAALEQMDGIIAGKTHTHTHMQIHGPVWQIPFFNIYIYINRLIILASEAYSVGLRDQNITDGEGAWAEVSSP